MHRDPSRKRCEGASALSNIQRVSSLMMDFLGRAHRADSLAGSLPAGPAHDRAERERDELYIAARDLRRLIIELEPTDLTDAAVQLMAMIFEMDTDAPAEPQSSRRAFANVAVGLLITLRDAGAKIPDRMAHHFLTVDQAARLDPAAASHAATS